MITEVYLIRHGATALNRVVPNRLQGSGSNPPLDDVGVDQATRTARALADRRLAAVYASPLARAFETARIVAVPHSLEPRPVPALIEAQIGRWEGLSWEEARLQDPTLYEEFHAHAGTTPYPGGESFLDVQARALPAIAALAALHPGRRVVVVAHNVVNRAVLAALLDLPIDRARSLRQGNCGINVLRFEGPEVTLVTLNSCLHLDD